MNPPFEIGTGEELSLKIKSIYDDLSRKIRDLQIPLPVTSVQGISNVFSYTELFPPIPSIHRVVRKITVENGDYLTIQNENVLSMAPRYVAPIECVIQMAQHSKWPNDLEALRSMITEFYFVISTKLKEEHKMVSLVTKNYMDVYYEGLVFRLIIYQPKEIILMKKVYDEGVVSYKENVESFKFDRKLNILPKIQGALNG